MQARVSLLVCLPVLLTSQLYDHYHHQPLLSSSLPISPALLLSLLLSLVLFGFSSSKDPKEEEEKEEEETKPQEQQPRVVVVEEPVAPLPPPSSSPSSSSLKPAPLPYPNSTAEDRVRKMLSPDKLACATRLVQKLATTLEYDHALFAPNLVNAKRFLQARNWNEDVAEKLWRKAALWRIEYKLTDRRARMARLRALGPGFDAKHDFIERHDYLYFLCNDPHGVPVVVLGASTADPCGVIAEMQGDMEDAFMDRIIDMYERALEVAIARDVLDFGLIEIFDLRNVPDVVPNFYSRATNAISPFKSFAKISDEVYVERVRKAVIVGPPRMFSLIWNAFLPLIPTETKKKISVLAKQDDWVKELVQVQGLRMADLPANYGGNGSDANVKVGGLVPKGSYKQFLKDEPTTRSGKPIGMIADVQYADEDDGENYAKSRKRKYRASLQLGVAAAVDQWRETGCDTVVQLGDLIDGFAKKKGSVEAWQRCISAIETTAPAWQVHHLVGNHELYNFPTQQKPSQLAAAGYRASDVQGYPQYRWIFLDAYEVSVLHQDQTTPEYRQALDVLLRNHPRDFRQDKDWLKQVYSLQRRFVPYNGQVSQKQLVWLRGELEQCVAKKQFALVCTHVPLQPGSCAASCLMWNYPEVLEVVHEFAASAHGGEGGAVAVFAGHDHRGGFALDKCGVAHITLTSPLEAEHSVAFSMLELGRRGLWLRAFGSETERVVSIPTSPEQAKAAYAAQCRREITALYHEAQQQQQQKKTWEECEQVFMANEGNWDELPPGWPRKFKD